MLPAAAGMVVLWYWYVSVVVVSTRGYQLVLSPVGMVWYAKYLLLTTTTYLLILLLTY